ncbi:hypothetical protein BTVI_16012 [Pitangus sulphuratus]|nr:hypothetical protein BTVI_16012 [Pitangus sulphuratus]
MMVRGVPQSSEKGTFKSAERKLYLQDSYRTLGPKSVSGKVMKQISLEDISKCMKAEKGTVNGHHGFMKNKSCLVHMTVFCKEMAVMGLMLEPKLFNMSIDDMYDRVEHTLSKLAHNSKVEGTGSVLEDRVVFERNIERLEKTS